MSSLAQSYISCKLAIRPLGLLYFTGPLFKKCIVKMMYLYQKMITLGTRMMSSYHLPLYFTFTKFMDKNSWFVKYKLPKKEVVSSQFKFQKLQVLYLIEIRMRTIFGGIFLDFLKHQLYEVSQKNCFF